MNLKKTYKNKFQTSNLLLIFLFFFYTFFLKVSGTKYNLKACLVTVLKNNSEK